jgi:hypothetical protein
MSYRFSVCALLLTAAAAPAQQAPSFRKHVAPFLARFCVECHPAKDPDGQLDLTSYKGLMKGGTHGEVIVPGQPDKSPLVRQVEGKAKPPMPPTKAKLFPTPEEYAVLRAWVQAGAKDDSNDTIAALPDIKPRAPVAAPVTALAYRPDGKLLLAGGHRQVTLIDPGKGEVVGTLPNQAEKVTAAGPAPSARCASTGPPTASRP